MRFLHHYILLAAAGLFVLLTLTSALVAESTIVDWGFFAHRRINRLAVFTLPPEMTNFYKKHIEFITEHAVDPDKRRYATKHEGPRHFIDIDHWSDDPFNVVPRQWTDALLKYADVYAIDYAGDTTLIFSKDIAEKVNSAWLLLDESARDVLRHDTINYTVYREWFKKEIVPQYYEDKWTVSGQRFRQVLPDTTRGQGGYIKEILVVDQFSEYGILPYNLEQMLQKLTDAFATGDLNRVLRYSAEMGHYIGDAHVPLHT
ncbi:MAG: hypothetical protein AAGK47_05605, partial [Bacteroidota bacterium]